MSPAEYLIDTSALHRILLKPGDHSGWEELIKLGTVAVSPITELEVLHSARSIADQRALGRATQPHASCRPDR
ncbi:PIN domain-containing protein [Marinactinospora rubrisoli]|uniref:PIN domain-containing protein n=1 Tax=Marinactinospora rubrisoli TaxID=2715399 RepID=A0ABW2KLH2_9ACTN